MGQIDAIRPSNLSQQQFEAVRTRLMNVCDRLCDAQVLELADALHEVIRARQSIRCRHMRVGRGLRPAERRVF